MKRNLLIVSGISLVSIIYGFHLIWTAQKDTSALSQSKIKKGSIFLLIGIFGLLIGNGIIISQGIENI